MIFYYFRCRSSTSARHAASILNAENVSAYVIKLPQSILDSGCGYAVKVSEKYYEKANTILRKNNIDALNIFIKTGTEYHEVRS